MEKLVLIDGNSLLNRAYYATPVFSTRDGTPTNAIFGFVKLLLKILEDVKPEYIIVAFDLKAPTFRHKMFEGYKATRKPMPEDLAAQVKPLKNLLSAMNIAMCEKEGFEADDIIGTLSDKFDVHSYIYTGDRDSFQLVNDKTDVYFTRKGVSDLQKLTVDNFFGENGFYPSQVVELKAVMGDKSDNIPGVAGIGEKGAKDLIARFGTLDNIYANIDDIKGALKNKLQDGKDLAYLSHRLATIDRNCPLDVNLEDCRAKFKYGDDVKKIFGELEFSSLLAMDIFENEMGGAFAAIEYPENVICATAGEIADKLKSNNEFAVDFEGAELKIFTGGVQYCLTVTDNLLGVGLAEIARALADIFGNRKNRVKVFNCKNLMHKLRECCVELLCEFEDVALAGYLCGYNLADNLKDVCKQNGLDYKYAAFDVDHLYNKYAETLEEEHVTKLYADIEKPLVKILFEMETEGVKVSPDMLDELGERYKQLLEQYKNSVYEKCGKQFNLNSPSQLGEVLYTNLGITEVKKKKTGKYVTGADVLEKLADSYPVIADVLKFRQYQKLYSTYIEGFRPLIEAGTHLVHTTYNQTATVTGRLSSANPNLQNIPVREEEGKELRKIFVPRDGNVFIDADYSQIELRLLAHFSGCKELVEAYNLGVDIHTTTASQVFGVAPENVTAKMRRAAKAVNFGIIYGISEFGLAKNLNIDVATARDYIDKYFKTYSAVKEYMNENVEFAKQHGYVSTLTGRKRFIPEIKSANFNIRQFGERAAMNMPLQGSSADIIKIAMIKVCERLKKEGIKAKLILQVHDELVLDCPENETERAVEALKYEMEHAVSLKVPLTVEAHCGKNWYEAK